MVDLTGWGDSRSVVKRGSGNSVPTRAGAAEGWGWRTHESRGTHKSVVDVLVNPEYPCWALAGVGKGGIPALGIGRGGGEEQGA